MLEEGRKGLVNNSVFKNIKVNIKGLKNHFGYLRFFVSSLRQERIQNLVIFPRQLITFCLGMTSARQLVFKTGRSD